MWEPNLCMKDMKIKMMVQLDSLGLVWRDYDHIETQDFKMAISTHLQKLHKDVTLYILSVKWFKKDSQDT